MELSLLELLKNHNNNRVRYHWGSVELVFCASPNSHDVDSSYFTLNKLDYLTFFGCNGILNLSLMSHPLENHCSCQISPHLHHHNVNDHTAVLLTSRLLWLFKTSMKQTLHCVQLHDSLVVGFCFIQTILYCSRQSRRRDELFVPEWSHIHIHSIQRSSRSTSWWWWCAFAWGHKYI